MSSKNESTASLLRLVNREIWIVTSMAGDDRGGRRGRFRSVRPEALDHLVAAHDLADFGVRDHERFGGDVRGERGAVRRRRLAHRLDQEALPGSRQPVHDDVVVEVIVCPVRVVAGVYDFVIFLVQRRDAEAVLEIVVEADVVVFEAR